MGADVGVDAGAKWKCLQNRPSCLAEADAKPGVEEDTHSHQSKMPKATPDRAVLIHAGLLSAGLSLDLPCEAAPCDRAQGQRSIVWPRQVSS